MSLYVKVFTNFYTHRKTMRLRAILGDDAFWVPPRLWAYAAENQPDGDFSGYTDPELAMLIGYSKDASSMLQALMSAGFLDSDRKVHDWAEHNSYHQVFSNRARSAAKAKWEKARANVSPTPPSEKTGEDMIRDDKSQASYKHPSSMLQACFKHLSDMFQRPESEPMSYLEQSGVAEICRRPNVEAEIEELQQFQAADPHFFPQSLERLLANWQPTLDRARLSKKNGQPNSKPDHRAERRAREYPETIKARRL